MAIAVTMSPAITVRVGSIKTPHQIEKQNTQADNLAVAVTMSSKLSVDIESIETPHRINNHSTPSYIHDHRSFLNPILSSSAVRQPFQTQISNTLKEHVCSVNVKNKNKNKKGKGFIFVMYGMDSNV